MRVLGKVASLKEVLGQRSEWSAKGKRVVFLAGRFDLVHPGHIRLLEQARDMGDVVVVAVFGGDCVEATEKDTRPALNCPVMPGSERAEVLAAFAAVDVAFEIDAGGLSNFLRQFRPDAIIDGADSSSSPTPLAAAARANGIAITHVPLEPGHSS